MRKKSDIPQADLNAFYEAMSGTRPLKQDKIRLNQPYIPHFKKNQIASTETEQLNITDGYLVPTVKSEEALQYRGEGISDKILRKLRKGQYNVEATLDLHSMTIDAAKNAVELFLARSLASHLRVVLIIHGKGQHSEMPILKNKMNNWLRTVDAVLAFCSATPFHGSRGAMYVLLKRYSKGESLA